MDEPEVVETPALPAEERPSLSQRVRALLLDARLARRERALARRLSRESLRIYREVRAQHPELEGPALYRAVISRQAGLDETAARRFVERAEDTFASWPEERPVTFRDVVQYLAVERWLAIDPDAQGFRTRLAEVVAKQIPEDL